MKKENKPDCLIVMLCFTLVCIAGIFYFTNYGIGFGRAAAEENIQKVKTYLTNNPDLIHAYPDGHTALHYAAANGQLDMVKFLLKKGADWKTLNEDGLTPSQLARKFNHPEIASYLENLDKNSTSNKL